MTHWKRSVDSLHEWYIGVNMTGGHVISTALDSVDEYLNTRLAEFLLPGMYPHTRTKMYTDKLLPDMKNVSFASHGSLGIGGGVKYLVKVNEGLLVAQDRTGDGRVWLTACAASPEACEAMIEAFAEQLAVSPRAEVPEGQVRVNFWNHTPRGPSRRARKLYMPTWEEIKGNYSNDTATGIDEFMTMQDWDDSRGKLILWRGDPGLGKTYALRSMCDNWCKWSTIHYITDPEAFLNDPDYIYSVVGYTDDDDNEFGLMDEETMRESDSKHRLVILEDAGELVGAEARHETGQALSRLLNVVDGMFGQGMQCVMLITTNEEQGKLHEAVGRNGRCAKDVTFEKLSKDEARAWMTEHDGDPDVVRASMTLSDLYAALHKHSNSTENTNHVLGFAGV